MSERVDIIKDVSKYVYRLFKTELSNQLLFHNYQHALEAVGAVEEIADNTRIDEREKEILMLAAWLHDTGFTREYKGHERESIKIARQFLEEHHYPEEDIQCVVELIYRTDRKKEPETTVQEIMYDADILSIGKETFHVKSDLLRAEWEIFCDQSYTDLEWEELQLSFLINTRFYTEYAQRKYGPTRYLNIKLQQKKLAKARQKEKKAAERKEMEGRPERGIETMFSASYRNHINLSAIADSKANMMISINTIIMSLIITIVGSGFSIAGSNFYQHIRFIPPISLLLLTCLASVIFAILSARPNVTSSVITNKKIKNMEVSPLYFGNFIKMDLPEFHSTMTRLMEEKNLLYGNMITDLYYLGKVLKKKYALLRISYSIFMVGLILAVLLFVITFLLTVERTPS